MKTTWKTIIAAAAAIAAAFVLRGLYIAAVEDPSADGMTTEYQDMMLTAREMFVEKSDDIQFATMELLQLDEARILTGAEGEAFISEGETLIPAAELLPAAEESLESVFSEYDCGGRIYNIDITPEAVIYYTGYYGTGCVGFLYERELGAASGYTEMFELIENWKIFYIMAED